MNGCGGWIRTSDLEVMSLASYQAAPPRDVRPILPYCRAHLQENSIKGSFLVLVFYLYETNRASNVLELASVS